MIEFVRDQHISFRFDLISSSITSSYSAFFFQYQKMNKNRSFIASLDQPNNKLPAKRIAFCIYWDETHSIRTKFTQTHTLRVHTNLAIQLFIYYRYYYYVFVWMGFSVCIFRSKTVQPKPIISVSYFFFSWHQLHSFQCFCFSFAHSHSLSFALSAHGVETNYLYFKSASNARQPASSLNEMKLVDEKKKCRIKSKVQKAKLSRRVAHRKFMRRKSRWQNKWS